MFVNLSKCTCNTAHTHCPWCPFCIGAMTRLAQSMQPMGERVELNYYPPITRDAGFDAPLIRV